MATKFLDKTGLSYFWSKIKAWCNATFAAITHSHAWSTITGKPTTISGYGITDAKIDNGIITIGSNTITPLTSHQTLPNLSRTISGSGNAITDITVSGHAITATKGSTFLTSHQDISGKVNKSGDTMTGGLTITNSYTLRFKHTGITRGTASSNFYPFFVEFRDNTDNLLGGLYYTYDTNKVARTHLMCYQGTTNANTWNSIGVGYDSSGNVYTWAPTPATADNSAKIATTAFVKAQNYTTATGHTHSYLPLGGGTLTGGLEIAKNNYPSFAQKDTDTTGTHIDFTHRDSSATALFNIRTYTGETQIGRKRTDSGSWYEGSEILLYGSGDTAIKANNGTNAYNLIAKASVTGGELVWTGIQSRMAYGNYGVIFRNDGSSFYLLKTASGSATSGSWDSTRPLTVNLSTGVCNISGNAATATKATNDSDGNAINSTYLKLGGGTMTGNIILKKSNITRGSSTTAVTCDFLDIKDSANNRISCYSILYFANKSSETNIYAYNTTVSSGGNIGYIGIGCNSSGTVYTHAPTPATSSNDTNIATTAFVKAQGYTTATGHTHNKLITAGSNVASTSTNTYASGIFNVMWFNATGKVPGQPSQYGFLTTFATGDNASEVHQIWCTQANGDLYHRGTNGSSYTSPPAFKKIIDSSNETQLSLTNSGSGNAVTGISVSNHAITVTKGSTFLTSHQSLANYVTLNSAQNNITGAKRFVNSIGMDFAEDYYNNNPSTNVYRSLNVQESTHKYTMADILYANNSGSSATWILRLGFSAAINSFFGVYQSNSDSYCVSYCDIIPSTSGNDSCGRTTRKWDKVWAVTGTIQTSDKRLKEDIIDIPDVVLDVWENVSWKQFKLKKSIKEKGSELARIHSGVIAQDIQELFNKVDIDCGKYGFFCYDEWDAEEARYDDDGNLLMPGIEADNQYSIRYEEALCIEAAYQRRKNKILENRISELETQVQNMLQILESLKGA